VGYRFYDKKGTLLRFPFGYGLSYTDFEFVDASVSKEGGNIKVEVDVKNIGAMDASEVVQVYAGIDDSKVFRPVKELVGFVKIHINAGETARAAIDFSEDDLAFWHAGENRFVVENGKYNIYIGADIADIRIEKEIVVNGRPGFEPPYGERVMKDYEIPPTMVPESFEGLLGYEIPEEEGQVSIDSSLNEIRDRFLGGIVYKAMAAYMGRDCKKALKMPDSPERDAMLKNAYFLKKVIPTNTFRSMAMASGGLLSYKMAKALAMFSGGRLFKAVGVLFTKEAKVRLPVEKK
jgi:beta-glucosidase